MVVYQRFQQHGSLVIKPGIRIPADDAPARAMDRQAELSDVAHGFNSEVLGQRTDILDA